MKLYEIDAALENLINDQMEWAQEHDGDVTDYPLAEYLAGFERSKSEKIINLALVVKNLSAESDAIKAEADALTKRRRAIDNQIDSLKGYMLMHTEKGDKFSDSRAVVSIRESQSVVIDDIEKLPEDFVRYEPKADKMAIKAAMKSGDVPGAHIEIKKNVYIK